MPTRPHRRPIAIGLRRWLAIIGMHTDDRPSARVLDELTDLAARHTPRH